MSEQLNIFNKHHVMIDIETASKWQNASILSIGACKFTFEDGVSETFYTNVKIDTCIALGMHIQKETLQWWANQSEEARNALKGNQIPIVDALIDLNEFVNITKTTMLWAQGSVFDFGILSSAFTLAGVKKSWNYWQENDSRTVFNLLGIRNDQMRKNTSNHHNALGDAIAQTETLIASLKG